MKKILFDLTKTQPLNGTKFHGGGKYGIAVFKKIVELAPDKIAAYYNESLYIDSVVMKLCQENNIPVVKKSERSVTDAAKMFGGVLYSPLNDSAYLKDSEVHAIVTIHGLRVLEMPYDKYEECYAVGCGTIVRFLKKSLLYKYILERKRKKKFQKDLTQKRITFSKENLSFVTVSNHSKYSLLSFFPELREKNIKVFYSPSTIDDSVSLDDYKNPYGKYFLIVSGNRWLKNSVRAMLALDELITEHPDFEGIVVVTGLKEINEVDVKIKNLDRFVFLEYVEENQLKGLYRHANLLVYPSLNEGFGYPPLEAMHEGCPVVASAIASIPEICGDAVMYFNPFSTAEIKMRILQMENSETKMHFIKKGIEREKIIAKKQAEDLESFAEYILSYIK